jgi:hypothetical protein
MEVVDAQTQSYVHHDGNSPKVTIFTPYPDILMIIFETASTNTTRHQYNISIGLTFVDIPPSCHIKTTELVVFASTDTIYEGQVPSIFNTDLSAELIQLAEDLEDIHSLNMTSLSADFASFAASVGATTVDMASAMTEMKKSQHITSVLAYTPLSVNWEDGGSVSNTVSVLSYEFLFLLVIGIALTCCQCCGCNICTAIGKGVWKIIAALTRCAYAALCVRNKQAKCDISLDSSPKKPKVAASTKVPW